MNKKRKHKLSFNRVRKISEVIKKDGDIVENRNNLDVPVNINSRKNSNSSSLSGSRGNK
jgi:hypothetical protein